MFESTLTSNQSVGNPAFLQFVPNHLGNLAFRRRHALLESLGITSLHPNLHFDLDFEQIDQMTMIIRTDFLRYYANQVSSESSFNSYLVEKYSQMVHRQTDLAVLGKMVGSDRLISETLFTCLKRNSPKVLASLRVKNSGAKDSKRTRLSPIVSVGRVAVTWRVILQQKGLVNTIKFGQNDSM